MNPSTACKCGGQDARCCLTLVPIASHAQACACAFLNARLDHPEARVPYAKVRAIAKWSLLTEDEAIGRLLRRERG